MLVETIETLFVLVDMPSIVAQTQFTDVYARIEECETLLVGPA